MSRPKLVQRIAMSPTGRYMGIAASPEASMVTGISVHDTADGRLLFENGHRQTVRNMAFHPTKPILAAVSSDPTLHIYNFLRPLPPAGKQTYDDLAPAHLSQPVPDGDVLDAPTRRLKMTAHRADLQQLFGGSWSVGLDISDDGRYIAATGFGQSVKVLHRAELSPVTELSGHAGFATGVAFCPGSSQLVTSGEDVTVRLWDIATWKQMRSWQAHRTAVRAVAVSPDGHTLITRPKWRECPVIMVSLGPSQGL